MMRLLQTGGFKRLHSVKGFKLISEQQLQTGLISETGSVSSADRTLDRKHDSTKPNRQRVPVTLTSHDGQSPVQQVRDKKTRSESENKTKSEVQFTESRLRTSQVRSNKF